MAEGCLPLGTIWNTKELTAIIIQMERQKTQFVLSFAVEMNRIAA